MGQSEGRPEVGEVQNLTAILQPNYEFGPETFLTLQWDAPIKNSDDEITSYDIRFKPKDGDSYREESVDGSSRTITLTKASGIKPLTTYKFEVRARIGDTEGKWKAVSQYIALTPAPVQNFTATVDTHTPSITLNWDPSHDNQSKTGDPVTKYDVRFKSESEECYSEKSFNASTTSLVVGRDLGIKPLLKYSFEVRPRNAYIAGKWETVMEYVALNPDPVQNVRATVNPEVPSVDLSWDPPANASDAGDVTTYHICFKQDGREWCNEMTLDGSTTSVALTRETGLVPQTTYEFAVRAQSGDDVGEWETVSAYLGLIPGLVNLSMDMDPHKPSLTLSWKRPDNIWDAKEMVAYDIHYKLSETDEYEEMSEDCYATGVTFTRQSGLVPLTTYEFKVRARSEDGEGEWNTVSTIFAFVPDPVQNLTIIDIDENEPSVTLTWDPPDNVKSDGDIAAYEVRFKTEGGDYDKRIVDASTTSIVLTSGPHAILKWSPKSDKPTPQEIQDNILDPILFVRGPGLVPLTTSLFEVRALNCYCAGEWSRVSTYVALDPDPVRDLSVCVDPTVPSITLSWDPPTNAINCEMVAAYKYQIRISPVRVEQHVELTVDGSTTRVILTRELGLTPLTQYHFQVRPMAGGDAGDWRSVSAYFAHVPGPVENLVPTVNPNEPAVTLSWDPPVNSQYKGDILLYDIRFKASGRCDRLENSDDDSSAIPNQNFQTKDGSITSFVVTREMGLVPLTTAAFEVRAVNANETGGSGEWTAVSIFVALVPGEIQNLKRSVDKKQASVTLSWDPPLNFQRPDEVTNYQTRFKPIKGSVDYTGWTVDVSTTSIILRRDSGLKASTMYSFEVRAGNAVSAGVWRKVTACTTLHPDPVRNLSAAVDANIPTVTLSWNPPANVQSADELTGYWIDIKPDGNENAKALRTTVEGSNTTEVFTRALGLEPLVRYRFKVWAKSGHTDGESKEVSVYFALVPGQVQNLRSTLDTNQPSLTLTWDKPKNVKSDRDVSNYDIRFRPSGSVRESDYCEGNVKASATSVHLTRRNRLKPLIKYDFEVRAWNSGHNGNWSTVSKYIALTPGPIQNLTATVDAHQPSVTLNWDPPANAGYPGDITKYQIQFWDKEKGCYNERPLTVDGSRTSIVITRKNGLRPLTTTTFEVRAYSGDDVSQETRTAPTFLDLIPDPIQNLKVELDSNVPFVTLTWQPPQNVGAGSQSCRSDVSSYHICFKPQGREYYDEMSVDSSTTRIILKRDSGLIPHTTSIFKVRAQCGDDLGEWTAVSTFIALVPGQVQNLSSTLDRSQPSLTLNWDKPDNFKANEDVVAYDIRFRSSAHVKEKGNYKKTVKTPTSNDPPTHHRRHMHKPTKTPAPSVPSTGQLGYMHNLQSKYDFEAWNPCHEDHTSVRMMLLEPISATLNLDLLKNADFRSEKENDYCEVTVQAPATSVLLTRKSGLKPLTKYVFEVRAWNYRHKGEWSTMSEYIVLTPDPIQNLTASVDAHQPSVTLNWDPPANAGYPGDITKYQIQFWDKEKGCYNERPLTVDGSRTSIVITRKNGLRPLTTTTYEVRAYSGDDVSRECKIVSAFVALIPNVVEKLKADVDPNIPSVTLSWAPPQNTETQRSWSDVSSYHIRFKPQEREYYDEMSVDSSTTSVVFKRDSGLIPHTKSIFEVRAQCGDDLGQWRVTVSEYIPVIPSFVQGLKVLVDEHKPSVTLQWTKPSNIWTVQEVVSHEIRFSPCQSRQYGHRMYKELPPLEGYCRDITLGREQLRPLTTYDFEVRAVSSDGAGPWTVVTKHFSMMPDLVQNLTLTLDRNKPTLTLNWVPPSNVDFRNPAELMHYDIWFKPQSLEGYNWNCQIVPSSLTTLTLTRKSGLVLDHVSQFAVRAQNYDRRAGEWVSVTQMIDWNYQCRLPSCTTRRQERPDKTINDFCCKEHGRQFADLYCLYGDYPGCCQRKPSPVGAETPADFCEMHQQQAKEEGFAAVVELDSQSQTYRDLSKKFQKTWAKEKGPCPPIITIVKIVNPMVAERFESYRSRFLVYRGIEQHYHGTTLCCDLANYAELCDDPNCGACGIARRGFDPQRINFSAWQRFGNGFYFAPNSSKSYDYAAGNRFGATVTVRNTCYNAVLVCDIAPGRKYGIRYHTPHLPKPPPDYNSFHGKSKGIMGKGELNYDELVIFDYEAIRPCYIIFC